MLRRCHRQESPALHAGQGLTPEPAEHPASLVDGGSMVGFGGGSTLTAIGPRPTCDGYRELVTAAWAAAGGSES